MLNDADPLLSLLIKFKDITPVSSKIIIKYLEKWQVKSYAALLECNIFSEIELADIIAERLGLERIYYLDKSEIDFLTLKKIPIIKAKLANFIPMGLQNDSSGYKVLMTNPLDSDNLQLIKSHIAQEIVPAIGEKSFINRLLNSHYPLEQQLSSLFEKKCE